LRYGIPDFKMEKHHIDRRIAQMEEEGTRFRTGITVGVDLSWTDLNERYDAIIVATGAPIGRDLAIPGRELHGIHHAMDYLVPANRAVAGENSDSHIDVSGKNVIILGGGDTGADCLGTALRQGAVTVTTLAIGATPPADRPPTQPWPMTPTLFEVQSAHEEGGERVYLASTVEFVGDADDNVTGLVVAETEYVDGGRRPKAGTERTIPVDVVLLALGYAGADAGSLVKQLGVSLSGRGTLERESSYDTNVPGLFVAGDAGRGASLIVWAIAEGRAVAARTDEYLRGQTPLPSPVTAIDAPIHF
jgi:glutamate synthase (NADPH/NADH) small chain